MISQAYYPSYLTVQAGTINFTLSRIVILAVYLSIYLQGRALSAFKFTLVDKLFIALFIGQLVAGVITSDSFIAFAQFLSGQAFDIALPYFAVRMIITSKERYFVLLKGVMIIAVPLALIGLYQCITGNNPFGFLLQSGDQWGRAYSYAQRARSGLYRANVTISHPIMYGLFFAIFGPCCVGIWQFLINNKHLRWMSLAAMVIGVFSSMSSGPWLSLLLSIVFIVFWRWRAYWKPVLILILVTFGSVEVVSNRHFYDVLGRFTFDPGSAWYRSKLIDVALFEGGMSGHWMAGYGTGNAATEASIKWGEKIDGRQVDIVNHYILILFKYGLLGLVPFLGVVAAAIKTLVDAFKVAYTGPDKWLVWCLDAAVFGILASLFSVSLFGQPTSFFAIILGFCSSMPLLVSRVAKDRLPPISAVKRSYPNININQINSI